MNKDPFFSIVIPSYNRSAFLPFTIGSVLRQTFRNFEVLVVDDGSKDDTRKVMEGLLKEDSRIRYIHQENAERGAARNNGIRNARGTYVVFFDSDDEMKTDYLMGLHSGIIKKPDYNFYAAKYDFARNGKSYDSSMSGFREGVYRVDVVLKGNPFACNFCIKRQNPRLQLFEEDRDLAAAEDWIFLVKNLKHDQIYIIDMVGVSMHQHDGRSMQQNQVQIERRIKATELLQKEMSFSRKETKLLWGYTYYFCSVHAYLDFNRSQALHYITKAIRLLGPKPEFIKAYLKYIAGKQFVNKLVALGGR